MHDSDTKCVRFRYAFSHLASVSIRRVNIVEDALPHVRIHITLGVQAATVENNDGGAT